MLIPLNYGFFFFFLPWPLSGATGEIKTSTCQERSCLATGTAVAPVAMGMMTPIPGLLLLQGQVKAVVAEARGAREAKKNPINT